MTQSKRAFVLMPFATDFDDVYDFLIRAPLERAGYVAKRADDLLNQNNILEDIVNSIYEADLIVTDLTASNPNVYYELGLAHALSKPVVLLSQNISEVPFDLRSYRIIPYSTHFAKIQEAQTAFEALLVGIAQNNLRFGSPISDFLKDSEKKMTPSGAPPLVTEGTRAREEKSGLGLLDYQVTFETSTRELTEIIAGWGNKFDELTPQLVISTNELNQSAGASPVEKLGVIRRLGEQIDGQATWMKGANAQYRQTVDQMSEALDGILSLDGVTEKSSNPSGAAEFLGVVDSVEASIKSMKDSVVALQSIITDLPKMEKTFIAANNRFNLELDEFAGNADRTISVLARSRRMIR
jgi:hypothetical protein